MEPIVIDNIFDDNNKKYLRSNIDLSINNTVYDTFLKRSILTTPELDNYFSKVLEPLAKKIFKDDTIKSTYTLYARYDHPKSWLKKHKDDNACPYTIDYCLSSKTPWGIFVEGNEYILNENQALAFMGEEQEHWRGPFTDPENNCVEMIFFHFAPEDHWFFTKGKDYIKEIRKK